MFQFSVPKPANACEMPTASFLLPQVQIAHLKEQVARGELDAEKLTAVKLKEEALEGRVKCLLDELSEARACHTPVSEAANLVLGGVLVN